MRQPEPPSFGTERPYDAVGRQLGERGVPVGDAVETLRLAVVAEQAGLLQQVLVVVEDDRVDIERHGILLAVRPLRRLPVGGAEVAGLDAGGGEFVGRERAQHARRDAERHARFVVGHDVGTLADGGRGLHLGVERHAPFERRRLDLDLAGVFLVELVEHRLHADAVAAAEEIPPDDGVLGVRDADHQSGGRQRRRKGICGSRRFLPKLPRRLPASQALGHGLRASGSLAVMVAAKARGAKRV